MTDQELFALAVLVQADSSQMRMANEERLRHGHAPAYGDVPAQGMAELSAELKSRGILK